MSPLLLSIKLAQANLEYLHVIATSEICSTQKTGNHNVSKSVSAGVTCPRQLKLELKTTQIKKETFMQEGQVSVKCGPLEIVNPARPKWNAHILYPGRFCIGMQNSAHTVTFRSGPIFQP